LRLADEALLRAKRERRGSVGRATREDALGIELARELRRFLDAHPGETLPEDLTASLQPVVALETGPAPRLLGFEALARWTHPRLGPVPPDRLFGATSDRAAAVRLGRLVRRAALAIFAALRERTGPGVRLAINLSPAEVFDERLVDSLLADLETARVGPEAILLEITEEVLLERVSDQRLARLVGLRERGVRLALDDFGAGTSGLVQLLRLPIDLVKIDRRFVQALGREPKAIEIVRATVALARSLGLRVVAEGVESAEQARLLAEVGCDGAQGFLFGRPMGLLELRHWLEARSAANPVLGPAPARAILAAG
ncbi:MAG: EAL domain-containing protein, partial [Geminicoccaceae bacterium]|nr:EAL domain-containing protein [Geminicoccaceae bacterium]